MITNLSQLANLTNDLKREIESQGIQIISCDFATFPNTATFHLREESFKETFEYYEKAYFSDNYDQIFSINNGVKFMALLKK